MKKLLFSLILFAATIVSNYCSAQSERTTPKNFAGVFAGVEWNTRSGMLGAYYERTLLEKDRVTLGVKGTHVFDYEMGNMSILERLYDGTASVSAIMPTLHFFTARNHDHNRGFFLHSGLGYAHRRYENGDVQYNRNLAAFEAGFGWQLYIGRRTTLQLGNSILFAGEGGITKAKLSLGF